MNVGAYNGKKTVKITDNGLEATDSGGTRRFALLVRGIGGTNQDDPSTLIFFDGKGNASGSVGSNVNGDFIVGTTKGAMELRLVMTSRED